MTTFPSVVSHAVLSVAHLSKHYGERLAVDDLSLEVGPNEVVGLLGHNGAGKTTTLNMLMGVLTPSAGQISIAGYDLQRQRREALSRANFAAVYAALPGNMTVVQNLRIFARLFGVRETAQRIEDLLDRLGLQRFRNTRCGLLSSGEQTRVSLAKALLNEPTLLLLDEPTASLDPATARELRTVIRELASNGRRGVLWTSHNMVEVEEVCDRVLFMAEGRILLEGDPRTLPAEHGHDTLEDLFVAIARRPLQESDA